MRGLTRAEAVELALLLEPGERVFHELDALEAARRAERYDVDPHDGSYRVRPTELGLLALRLQLWTLS